MTTARNARNATIDAVLAQRHAQRTQDVDQLVARYGLDMARTILIREHIQDLGELLRAQVRRDFIVEEKL